MNFQKQPFVDIFQNKCSQKFRMNRRKTHVLECFFAKIGGLSY